MYILHRLSDLKILDGTSIDVYDNIGQLNSIRCKRLLTINKSVNIERGFTFRRGIPLKESDKRQIVKADGLTYEISCEVSNVPLDILLHECAET